MEKELKALEGSLRQVESAKLRLESQMDLLDMEDPHYERKMADLQRRYDEKYDAIADLEDDIAGVRRKIRNIRKEVVTADNIYRILLAFDDLYSCMEEKEKRDLMQAMIEKIEIYPEKRKDGCWIRSLTFKFPIPTRDGEIKEFPLESSATIESIVCLVRKEVCGKQEAFFSNAKLLAETFAITPLLYGSLGLEYLTNLNLHADDIDILIPRAFLTEKWNAFRSALEEKGYALLDEREHTFEKEGIHYSYAMMEELETFFRQQLPAVPTSDDVTEG